MHTLILTFTSGFVSSNYEVKGVVGSIADKCSSVASAVYSFYFLLPSAESVGLTVADGVEAETNAAK